MKNRLKNSLLLFVTIILIIASDRFLLFYFGLPLWEWDEKLHFKHRPNITKYWENFGNKPIFINDYGQHDDSFPIKKGKKELRILNLGDSITMGHGVSKDETYSKYLEALLSNLLKNYQTIQAINTGVQGYSTFQEVEVLKRGLIFEPDIVTVGFCLNDVTEPFVVNKGLGGIGLDYHKVTQAPNGLLSYLLNETGFGRLIQEIRIRKLDAKQEKLAELFDVKKMLLNKNDSTYQAQWNFTLKKLNEIYSICKNEDIPVILLIFPFTFQINQENLTWAQELLINNATENNVRSINFLNIFQQSTGFDRSAINLYFLDEDHFTPLGHRVVAQELSKVLMGLPIANIQKNQL